MYCLSCFQSYTTDKKLRKHEKVCENHDFCHLKMPDEDNKILKYVSGEKLLKVPFVIYADLECLLNKINTVKIILINHILKRKLRTDHWVIL